MTALDRTGIVASLTGGNPVIDMDPISGGDHAMTERVLKAIAEVHGPPADARRMGAARPVHGWIVQADAAARLGLPEGMVLMNNDPLAGSPLTEPLSAWHGIPAALPDGEMDTIRQGHYLAQPRPAPLQIPTFEIVGARPPREGDQDLPTPNTYPAIQDLVIGDMEARKRIGLARYGTLLQPHNGRDVLRDLYEELLDAANYVRQAMFERDGQ